MSAITIGDKSYHLCPSYKGLCRIEERTATSWIALTCQLAAGQLSLTNLGVIFEELTAPGEAIPIDEIISAGHLGRLIEALAGVMKTIYEQGSQEQDELASLKKQFPD